MTTPLIRVLLVDDSPVALEGLGRILSTDPAIQVVGKAKNGEEALRLMPMVRPTIVCTDYFMPVMDGLELTRRIMAWRPCPVLVISGKLDLSESKNLFSLLEAGALDCLKKPVIVDPAAPEVKAFIERVRVLSGVFVLRKQHKPLEEKAGTGVGMAIPSFSLPFESPARVSSSSYKVIVIGASTGGPVAMKTILKRLPRDFPVPILYVQHIGVDFLDGFVNWIKANTCLTVKVPSGKEMLEPGTLYMPKGNANLQIVGNRWIASIPPPPGQHCPCIDVTMESVAENFNSQSIGILLTGIGIDGAKGLLAMHAKGAVTVAQERNSCVVFGMPAKAMEWGAAEWVLDLDQIGTWLSKSLCSS